MFEITVPEILRAAFVFGLLPGWWLGNFFGFIDVHRLIIVGTEKPREENPCVSEAVWHDVLTRTGFSGIENTFHDFHDASCHEMSLLVSKAVSRTSINQNPHLVPKVSIVVDMSSTAQTRLAREIEGQLEPNSPARHSMISLQEAAVTAQESDEHTMVYLLEFEKPYLDGINEEGYAMIQKSLSHAHRVLWVTSGGGDSPPHPGYGLFDGLSRVLRSENTQLVCVTLALDRSRDTTPEASYEIHGARIANVLRRAESQPLEDIEPEYVEQNGLLHINRMMPNLDLNKIVQDFDRPQLKEQAFDSGVPLALTVANPGMLDSLVFAEDVNQARPLAPNEVEIEVRAAGVNFMDCLTVLGRVNKSTLGGECAGVISRVGSACEQQFQPGDRVCAAIPDCFKSFVRSNNMLVTKIPDRLIFQHASSVPITGVTSHYALIECARLQKGESVLIHSAAGGVGQIAIQMAQRIGAIVYVTVGTDEKKRLLMETYGILEENILSSRNTSFAQGIMRLTGDRGVDVILNSLSGELLTASWDCIASFGRFVEIGKKDIHSHANLPMFPFRKNASFAAVDLDHMYFERPSAFRKSLLAVVKMLAEDELRIVFPLHSYPVSDIETAFRSMQSGKHMGKIVVDFQPEAPVKVGHPAQELTDPTR